MKKLTIVLLLSIVTFSVYSQQDPEYTQYTYNMNIINPAYAGSRGTLSIGLLGRTQWVGLDGSPKTATLAIHAPVGKNVALGLSFITDDIGPSSEQNIYADFSYTLTTSEEGRLAFGLKGGITLHDVNLIGLDLPQNDVDDLFDEDIHNNYANFGAGVYYYTDRFYLGFSAPNILEKLHIEEEGNDIVKAAEETHFFLTSGYVFNLSETLKFKPSTMLRGVAGSPLSIDVSANFLMNDRLELGLNYRFGDSVSGLINFGVTPDLRIGYAYDYTTTNLGDFNSGTHELFLQWDIDFSKKNLKSPRFF